MRKFRRLCLTAVLLGSFWAVAGHAEEAAELSVDQVEQIVRDYLLREPELVYEALSELQRRRDAEEAARQQAALDAQHNYIFANASDPIGGNATGDVTLVEFFDYRCGYCRSMAPALQALMAEDEQLRFVFKELPVLGEDSVRAAKAALAAERQDRYFDMHVALMRGSDLSQSGILATADALGLDVAKLAADMESPEVGATIDANLELAHALGISGTPSFVIGDTIVPGAAPVASIAQLIAQERETASN